MTVIGPDTSADEEGQVDFTIAAVADGLWTFDWHYVNTDTDDLDFDTAGYLVNGAYTVLGSNITPLSGSVSIAVLQGQIIGFRSWTADSLLGPA